MDKQDTKHALRQFVILLALISLLASAAFVQAQPTRNENLPQPFGRERLRQQEQARRQKMPRENEPATTTNESSEFAGAENFSAFGETTQRWEQVPGPDMGTVYTLLVKGTKVFAATAGGVFVSDNRGRSWHRVGPELWRTVFTSVDTGDSILAGTDPWGGGNYGGHPGGLWRSRDNGNTWQTAQQGLPDTIGVYSLTKVGAVLFAAAYETTTFQPKAYRSIDGGATWKLANDGLPDVYGLLLTGGQSRILAWSEQGVYRSDATGAQWTKVELNLPPNASLNYGLFPAASGDNFFIATSAGVYISNDGGQSWYASNYGLPKEKLVLDVGTIGQTPYVILDDGSLYFSETLGAEWKLRSPDFAIGRGIRGSGIVASGKVLLSGAKNGVVRSQDRGVHWNASNTGFWGIEVTTMQTLGNRLYVPAAGGVWMSRTKGETWSLLDKGFTKLPFVDFATYTIGIQGHTLYAGVEGGGLYASNDLGNSWTAVTGGLPEAGWPSIIKAIGNKLYVGYLFDGIWVSEDHGKSWKQIKSLPGDTPYFTITTYRNTIFVGTYGQGLFRSDDDGQTWKEFNAGLRNAYIDDIYVYRNTVLAGTDDGIYRLAADGSSWEELTNYAATIKGGMNYFARVGPILYASTWGRGIAVSYDNGETWAKLNVGLNTVRFYGFALLGDDLFVGSLGNGLFRLRNAGNGRNRLEEE